MANTKCTDAEDCSCPNCAHLARPLSEDEKTALRVMMEAGSWFTICMLAAKAGQINRKAMDRQGASADFLAEFERLERGSHKPALADAWALGFRSTSPKSG